MLLFCMRYFRLLGCLSLALLVFAGEARAQQEAVGGDRIEAIRFVGNEQTKPRIMLQEMVIHVGDLADPVLIERSRQAIMDLGLFKSVHARLLPGRQGRILEIGVNEKFYVIPLPRLDRTDEGSVSYGGRLTVDNLAGLNQRLKLTYEAQSGTFASDRTVHSLDLSYDYPRVIGSHYGLGFSLERQITPQTTTDSLGDTLAEHDRISNKASVGLSRWLSHEGPSQGWNAGASLFWRYLYFDQRYGAPLELAAEKAIGFSMSIGYTRVHDYLFSREGLEYGLISEHGLVALGSDTSYSRNQFYYRHFFPLGQPEKHRNFNMQLRFGGTGGGVPVDDYAYVLGGSRDLRGYDQGAIGGRSFFVMNFELLAPLWGHNAARGVVFGDVGNAYPDDRLLDFGDLQSSMGFGLRYKVKALVNLQLRVDVSYAFGLKRRKVYIGSKNTF